MTPLWTPEVEARVQAEAHSLDEQVTPDHVQMCTKCVVTNQRPRITFNAEGVCSACQYAERKRGTHRPDCVSNEPRSLYLTEPSCDCDHINWAARESELRDLCDRYRSTNGYYDVIVPCSGGKDSAMVAHRLKHEYNMHPLCVTWAPFIYTDIGRKNFDAFTQSGFDTIVCYPSGPVHRKLARLAFEYYGDPFQPFVYGQLAWPMQTSVKFGIPLVMYGENGEAEYGGDPSANDKPCWGYEDWDRVYTKGASVDELMEVGRSFGAITEIASPFYSLPRQAFMKQTGTAFHWFGYYTPWHPQANYYYACENTGFEANEERSQGTYSKYASLDDKLDGLHYYMSYVKFGIGRCTSDAAHEVRDGDLTRDEALALVAKYDGEFPERHLDECLEYLGMDQSQLGRVIARFRSPNIPMTATEVNARFQAHRAA